jgi:nicotinamide-nucleotide amidase
MNAEILSVGTELLMGQIANTNAQYISRRLSEIGINVYYHSVVGDNRVRLRESLAVSLDRSDAVILTGGLGPTQDDLTKETVAEAMGRKLVLNKEVLQTMKKVFSRSNRIMAKNNIKQAYLPENSIIIKNRNGTAPGCIIEEGGKAVIMLPGPPAEMQPMFEDYVVPFFNSKTDYRLVSKYLRIFGIGESVVEETIIDIINTQSNPTIAPYAKEGEVTLRITAKYRKGEVNETDLITPLIEKIKLKLGDAVYSTENEELKEVAARLLMKNNITVALAESCTGGLLTNMLTEIPGISKVLNRAVVSYSNKSKVEDLRVKQSTLESYGAVSKETAIEMAEGVRKISGTDIGVAVTGIAGPDGGTEEKPVGLVYVALSSDRGVSFRELKLWGERRRIMNLSALNALDMIRRFVLGIN